jgi:pimeloyl-ACP methyl ester carboxylesterase
LSFLKEFPTPIDANFNADNDRGFIPVESAYFNGVIHWSGSIAANTLFLHNVGESIEFVSDKTVLAFDLPGHGLSGDISDSAALNDWAEIIAGAVKALGANNINCIEGNQLSALLALAIAKTIGADCVSGTNAHIPLDGDKWLAAQPDLTPDRFGSHLGKAWQVVRSSQFFWPWFEARKTNAISFQQNQIDPEFLSVAHRALLRARSNTQLTKLLLNSEKTLLLKNAPKICNWNLADWAIERDDIWRP